MSARISTETTTAKEKQVGNSYNVTFIADYFVLTVVASDVSDGADRTERAIDVASEIIRDQYGFDPEAYAYDVLVEVAF